MTDNRTTELLPCPFCGGEAYIDAYGAEGTHQGRCRACGATGQTMYDEAEAIEAWNKRWQPPEPVVAPLIAPILRDKKEDAAYERGRFDERLQQEIMKGAC